MSATTEQGTVVLLEGPSDVAAVRAVAATHGLSETTHGYRLVTMGGATNIRRHLRAAQGAAQRVRVLGMCDAGEAGFFARALDGPGDRLDHAVLAEHGFQVCQADLEDELIRALGPDRVMGLLDRLGLGQRFKTFQGQRAWRGRPVAEQLHRFVGIASGRKILLAETLAASLDPGEAPAPLSRLVTAMAGGPSTSTQRSPRPWPAVPGEHRAAPVGQRMSRSAPRGAGPV